MKTSLASLSFIAVTLSALPLTGCTATQAGAVANTAADVDKGIACVAGDWGKPIETIALDCFGNVLTDAEDAVANLEILFESKGVAPSAYAQDARIAQIIILKQAKAKKP